MTILSFATHSLATLILAAVAAAQGGAGTTTVQTDPSDPDPIISISNPTQVTANDIEFEVTPGAVRVDAVGVDIDKTRMTDAAGNDLQWDKAVNHGGGKYSMKVGANGTGIAAGSGAGLELQSKTQSGWSYVVYSRTRNGRTLYTSVNLDSDTNPAGKVATGNTFPAGASAWLGITNTGSLAITDVTLSIDNEQVFESIGSELAGAGAVDLSANTATFYASPKRAVAPRCPSSLPRRLGSVARSLLAADPRRRGRRPAPELRGGS